MGKELWETYERPEGRRGGGEEEASSFLFGFYRG